MNKILILIMPILFFCFVLTFSRNAWMGFVSGLFSILLVNKKWYAYKKFLIVFLVVLLLGCFLIVFVPRNLQYLVSERFLSIFSTDVHQTSQHYEYLRKNIVLLIENPWGIGLGKGTAYIGEVWNESSLFKLAVEMGIIPGLLYVLIFVMSFAKCLSLNNKLSKTKQQIVLITMGLTVAYFVSGIVFPAWIPWFPTMILWILMAVVFNFWEDNNNRFIEDSPFFR